MARAERVHTAVLPKNQSNAQVKLTPGTRGTCISYSRLRTYKRKLLGKSATFPSPFRNGNMAAAFPGARKSHGWPSGLR